MEPCSSHVRLRGLPLAFAVFSFATGEAAAGGTVRPSQPVSLSSSEPFDDPLRGSLGG